MMRAGISMRDADDAEIGMYLKVLAHANRRSRERKDADPADGDGKNSIELRRGFADEFFG